MSLIAPVIDGKVQDTSAQGNSLSANKAGVGGNALDKDAFLQLLVAQMKYQDPLQPTSNTEYISQFATFSELEQMQNMSAAMDLQRASELVGKNVIMKVSGKNGANNFVPGKVDYVEYENGKAYLSIRGNLYSLDDLVTVVEDGYREAFDKINNLLAELYKLPTLSALTTDEMEKVLAIKKQFEELSEYEQGFLTDEEKELFDKYFKKMEELMKEAGIEIPEEKKQPTLEEMMEALLGKMDDLIDGVDNIPGGSGGLGDTTPPEEPDGTTPPTDEVTPPEEPDGTTPPTDEVTPPEKPDETTPPTEDTTTSDETDSTAPSDDTTPAE